MAQDNSIVDPLLQRGGGGKDEHHHHHEHTIQSIVSQLSLKEKISLISGETMWTCASRNLVHNKFPELYSSLVAEGEEEEEGPRLVVPSSLSQQPTPPFRVADGPHGLRKTVTDEATCLESVQATCFPTATALACSWDEHLLYQVGQAIAVEARNHKVDVILGPAMNIQRHPCGGRSFEYFSEDPLLTGRLATAIVQGIQQKPRQQQQQENNPSSDAHAHADIARVGACIKHVCVNNQESRRFAVNVVIDDRTLREIYLRGFEHVIRGSGKSGCSIELSEGGGDKQQQQQLEKHNFLHDAKEHLQPWTMMCAYNKLNGVHCSEHTWLFEEVIRKEWGFEGLVVTDWGATNDRVAGIKAGIDLEMPASGTAHHGAILETLEEEQELERDDEDNDNDNSSSLQKSLDKVVARNLALLFKASPPQRLLKSHGNDRNITNVPAYTPKDDASIAADLEAHHDLAYRVARDCTVLLKNDGNFLPLDKDEMTSIAVIGAFSKTSPRLQGMGSSQVNPYKCDTLWSCLQEQQQQNKKGEKSTNLLYAKGYDPHHVEDIHDDVVDETLLQEAIHVAQQATVSIIMIGVPEGYESEGFDRTSLELPLQHKALIEGICGTNNNNPTGNNNNTIVILCNGGPVTMPWVDRPRAILEGFLLGQAGGRALVDLMFGVISPSAKLAATFPLALQDIPAHANFPGNGNQVEYREGLNVGYRYFCSTTKPVLFPFGHGLSYATFDYHSNREVTVTVDKDDPTEKQVTVRFPLTNSSSKTGFSGSSREIVQCYVHACRDAKNDDGAFHGCTVYRPEIELKEFCKTPMLLPGETCWITITLTTEAFSFWDTGVSDWVVESGRYQLRIGASCQDIRLDVSVQFATGRAASRQARESHPPVTFSKTINDTAKDMNPLDDATFSKMLGYDIPKVENDHGREDCGRNSNMRLLIDRNTLLQDVATASRFGSVLTSIVWGVTRRGLQGGKNSTVPDNIDGQVELRLQSENKEMLEKVAYACIQNLPLRGLVLFAEGKMSFRMLDVIIFIMNGFYLQALRMLVLGKPKRTRRHNSSRQV